MAIKLVGQPKTVPITSQLARKWASMAGAAMDRPLSQTRLEIYKKIWEAGMFRPVTWAEAYCEETKTNYRIDGKHTSTLFSSLDLSTGQPLAATIQTFRCDTLHDVAKLYSTFDARTQIRSTSDVNRSFAAVIPGLVDVDLKTINLVVAGMSFANWPGNSGRKGRLRGNPTQIQSERAELLFGNTPFAMWIASFIPQSLKNAPLRRSPVVAAMFATWCKAQTDAKTFWAAVRDETGVKPGLPDRMLAKFLGSQRVNSGAHTTPRRYLTSAREFYVKCIYAWNAWRKDAIHSLKYQHKAAIPSPI